MDIFTSSAGYWKRITSAYVSSGGVWKRITSAYVSSGGVWKQFFGASLSPSIASGVSITTSSASYSATLTGFNYRWSNYTSLTYVFQSSTDNSNWSNLTSPATIANPSVGSSNSVTYTPTASAFTASPMYFRFQVSAYNSTYSTSSSSTSNVVTQTYPAPTAAQGTFGGSTIRGEMITYTPGATSNASSVSSYLKRADIYNTLLATSTGTSSILYTLTASDVDYQLYAYTTATGQVTSETSPARFSSYISAPAAPTAAAGSWSGTVAVGNQITYTRGASTNANSTYIYMYRSDGAIYVNAGTASSYSFTLTSNDVGYYFYAYSVASGAGGTATSSYSYSDTVPTPVILQVPGNLISLYGSNNLVPVGGTFYWEAPTSGGAVAAYYYEITKSGVAYSAGYTTNTYLQIPAKGTFQAKVNAYNSAGNGPVRTSASATFT